MFTSHKLYLYLYHATAEGNIEIVSKLTKGYTSTKMDSNTNLTKRLYSIPIIFFYSLCMYLTNICKLKNNWT